MSLALTKNPNSIGATLQRSVDALTAAGVPSPRADAELLISHVLGVSRGAVQAKAITGEVLGTEDLVTVTGLV